MRKMLFPLQRKVEIIISASSLYASCSYVNVNCSNYLEAQGLSLFHPADPQAFDHIGRSTRNSNPFMISSTDGAKCCSEHRFRAPLAGYTAQLLTLHQHRDNSQYVVNG